MRIKKYIAENYVKALKNVKQELGEDALVLSTRSIKYDPSNGGPQNASMVEITAAMEREDLKEKTVTSTFEKNTNLPTVFEEHDEIGELHTLIRSLVPQTERAKSIGLHNGQLKMFQKLTQNGINEQLAALAFKQINRYGKKETSIPIPLEEQLGKLMKKGVRCGGPISLNEWGPKIVALVGPTGSGKTTTIAKLGAEFALKQKKKVAFISLDTFRLGAVEQLQIYGDLMQVPVEVAADQKDFNQLIEDHSDKDLILIDTMGRNNKDVQYCEELIEIFKTVSNIEIHLVQSVTSQEQVMEKTIKQFSGLNVDRLLFTKLDEGVNFGLLFNVSVRFKVPFSYFTTGQRVPEDIEIAGQTKVIRLIFN